MTLIWAATLIIVVPVIGYYGYRAMALRRNAPAAAGTLAPAQGAQGIPEKSIAVLPFVDMSEKHDQEYFSDGLAEELLDLLAQVPDLRVPARTSSFYFKGKTDDVATIAQKLRVAHLLEGSVRRSGDKIRVTAQLIRADNGYHLWSKTYDRDARDVFQVQDEIANAVVTALKAQLLSSQPLTSRHRTSNPQAFNEYLLGNQLRERDTVDSNREALESYQRAAALDPGYAAAYSGIADAEWRVADQLTGEPAAYQRALAAAERAIALAPDSPEGYWARGNLRGTYFHDWAGAEADFRKALELDPNDAKSMREYGELLAARGDLTGGIEHLHRAVALDPLGGRARRQLAQLLLDAGKTAEAREAAQQLESVLPNSWASTSTLGLVGLAEGNFREALTQFQRDRGPWNLIGTAMAQHSLGNALASQAAMDQLLRTQVSAVARVPDRRGLRLARRARQGTGVAGARVPAARRRPDLHAARSLPRGPAPRTALSGTAAEAQLPTLTVRVPARASATSVPGSHATPALLGAEYIRCMRVPSASTASPGADRLVRGPSSSATDRTRQSASAYRRTPCHSRS